MATSLIHDLNFSRNDWKIKVRVSRLIDVVNFRKQNSLISLDMVLIDEEHFRPKLTEEKIYTIRYFSVQPNKEQYRIVGDNKIMIQFFQNTVVRAVGNIDKIPLHQFDCVQLQHLNKFVKNYSLPDVVGMVVNEVGDSIEIEDQWGQRAQLKIWSNGFAEYSQQRTQLGDSTKPFAIVVTSTMVKEFLGFSPIISRIWQIKM
ncbi:uncharacterized protein [Spinacia oleracea]|uniref:Uncharacterized protein n=1 Tax=Spinacia oleracea TaxID=3562 RepID=A0ABM3QPP4_SPIOL|nr:uncharacterized protein LOC130461313 [Spinacia oleracea]